MTMHHDPRLSPDRIRLRQPKRSYDRQRSRLGNGSVVVNGVDQRDRFPRRIREKQADYQRAHPDADIGERAIITNVCVLEFEMEEMTTEFALLCKADKSVPAERLDLYGRLCGQHRRQLQALEELRRARRERRVIEHSADDPLDYARRFDADNSESGRQESELLDEVAS